MALMIEDMEKITTSEPSSSVTEAITTTYINDNATTYDTDPNPIIPTITSTIGRDTPLYKDAGFIIALICFGIGAILLVIGFIRLLAWWIDTKKHERDQERWFRHLQHIRHLEDYSIRTGDATSVFGDNLSLYLSESKSMNGSVHGIKVKVGPFPKPSDDNDIEKKRSVSVESSRTELDGDREKKQIQEYYYNEGLEHL